MRSRPQNQELTLAESRRRLAALATMQQQPQPPDRAALLQNLVRSTRAEVALGEKAVRHQTGQQATPESLPAEPDPTTGSDLPTPPSSTGPGTSASTP